MATLRFKAKDGHLVRVPGSPGSGIPQYVGKTWDHENKTHVDSDKPFECDADSRVGQALVSQVVRWDSLIPDDDDTAARCGKLKEEPAASPTPTPGPTNSNSDAPKGGKK